LGSAFLRSIVKLSREVLGFSDIGIISLNENLICDNDHALKNREIFEHLKVTTINKHDWARTVIVLIRPYIPHKVDFPHGFGYYSAHYKQYPLGRKATQLLASFIEDAGFRTTFDSGIPVKAAAFCAGLGKYGKNSLVYTKEYGSFITIHTVVTDASFDCDNILAGDISDCGNCNLCIDACPTNAIANDGGLSKGRCLREHMLPRNYIPLEMRKLLGSCILGCDICQIVCPANKDRYAEAVMPPDEEVKAFDIEKILSDCNEMDGIADYIGSIIGTNYAKKEQILSAATITAGNMKEIKLTAYLTKLLKFPHPSVRAHAAWALAETDAQSAKDALKDVIAEEADETVRFEMENLISLKEATCT